MAKTKRTAPSREERKAHRGDQAGALPCSECGLESIYCVELAFFLLANVNRSAGLDYGAPRRYCPHCAQMAIRDHRRANDV